MAEHDQVPQDQDENIVVEVVEDDLPVVAAEGPEGEARVEPKVVTPEEGMAELRGRLEAEQCEREAAEGRAREAATRAEAAGREVLDSRAGIIASRLGETEAALDRMTAFKAETRRSYAAALQAGDYEKAAELQDQMAESALAVQQLQANKARLVELKRQPAPAPRQPTAPQSGLEAFLAHMPPKQQAWLRARPDFVTDAAKNKRLVAAHHTAALEHEEGSDGYFAAIEKQLGLAPAKAETLAEPAARRPAPVAAPPSRGAPSLSRAPTTQTQVRLTATEVQMAKDMGLTVQEYARAKRTHLASKPNGVTEH